MFSPEGGQDEVVGGGGKLFSHHQQTSGHISGEMVTEAQRPSSRPAGNTTGTTDRQAPLVFNNKPFELVNCKIPYS